MDTKFRLETFAFYDHNGIAAHLEKMAAKGWMIEDVGSFLWEYRRIEPKRLRFAVTYIPEMSFFTVGPPEEQLLLRDYCEAAGWKQAVSNAWMQVFYSEEPEPVPLETDAALQVANINAAAWKTHLRGYWLLFGLVLVLAFICIVFTGVDELHLRADPGWMLMLTVTFAFVLLCVVELAAYYIWYDKAERIAREQGVLYPTKSRRIFQWTIAALALAAVLWDMLQQRYPVESVLRSVLRMILPFLIVGGCRFLQKRFKLSEGVNRVITVLAVILYLMAARRFRG